ncbi:unnamed protein product [Dracunculus medinensis]|uniref:Lipase_GDSL domain-containing protein n=1 Tax=Dracunculus medinensis TaxID=318479 RepID=A0A158Q2L7_DRAME|nr:unnamed protein product [Dracunculus medinensis]
MLSCHITFPLHLHIYTLSFKLYAHDFVFKPIYRMKFRAKLRKFFNIHCVFLSTTENLLKQQENDHSFIIIPFVCTTTRYVVTLKGWANTSNKIIMNGRTVISVRDYWIASIGDSFASGEGNPDIPAGLMNMVPAKWISDQCHRSSRSWAFKVFEKILNETHDDAIHFTYIPCTGASVDNGILISAKGDSQMDTVLRISKLRGSGPDLLLMSVGGNDIGYSEILSSLIWGKTTTLFETIDMRFFYASYQFDRLALTLKKIKPSQIVIPHYFDLTRNERGIIDADCAEMRQIRTENLILAEKKILQRINKLISKKAQLYCWTVVDEVAELFRSRGSVRDSLRLQGNSFGAFHPIEEAHQSIADLIWNKLKFQFHYNH